MLTFIARRLIQGGFVLLVVTFICFAIFRYAGDPVLTLAGRYATVQEREMVRKAFGLDRKSYINRVPVLGLILERLPATVELALSAIFISITLGVGLGVLVSLKPGLLRNRLIMAGSLFNISIPTFLTGILLIMVFAVYLKILPPFGRGETVSIGFWRTGFLTWSGIKHLILPAFTLGMYQLAVLLRLTRAGMREVLTEEYIKTAWAKGLPARTVIFKHALRNVLIPVVTMTGLQFGELIAFSFVTETIFQWPGTGNLLLTSIYETDILTINFIVDVLYAFLNPKIQYA